MNEYIKFNDWQEVIIDFFENKSNDDEEKYLKEEIKKIDKDLKSENYFNDEDLKVIFTAKKAKEIFAIDFQRQKIQSILNCESIDTKSLSENYINRCNELREKYNPSVWLSKNAQQAKSVSFSTHVVKLTHSKITSPSFYDCIDSKKNSQLSTSALKTKIIDGAVAGNQFAPIFQFLELEFNGNKLSVELAKNENKILESFAKDENELDLWNNGFKQALSVKEISSHSLTKQIYFPISKQKYHLLCNVKSSSLAHKIYESIFYKQPAREQRNKNKFSERTVTSFINKAKLGITGSNHSNASQLNGKRGGKLFLFSTQPPIWQSTIKPPIYKKSLFDNYYTSQNTKESIKHIVDFILRFEKIDLSIKNQDKKQWIEKWTNYIIDDFVFYMITIQNLPAGWSNISDIKLKPAHQYLLDPYCDDVEFQANIKENDWQKIVVNDFVTWLDKQLLNNNKLFTPQKQYSKIFKDLMTTQLRELNDTIAIDGQLQQGN